MGVFVRTPLVRTTRLCKVSLHPEVLFQSIATCKFGPVIERDRATVLLVELFETVFQPLMDVVGLLRLDFEDDREPRFAVHEGRQATSAGRAEDRVAFKIAQPDSLLDDFRTIGNAGAVSGSRVFAAVDAFAPPSEQGLPMLAILVIRETS